MSTSKITGEEERYSHTDLSTSRPTCRASQAAFDAVKPILEKKNPSWLTEHRREVRGGLPRRCSRTSTGTTTYVAYTDLTEADTKALPQAIDALAEPLSKVAKQVVGS